jgi:hypothetical protein
MTQINSNIMSIKDMAKAVSTEAGKPLDQLSKKEIVNILQNAFTRLGAPTNLAGNQNLHYIFANRFGIDTAIFKRNDASVVAENLAEIIDETVELRDEKGVVEKAVDFLCTMVAGSPGVGESYMKAVGSRGTHRPSR